MDTKHDSLITRLHDEADLCRNDGVPETAKLLDEAIARIEELERMLGKLCTHDFRSARQIDADWDDARALMAKKD